MLKKIKLPLSIAIIAIVFVACERDFDSPPITELTAGQIITLNDLRDLHQGSDLTITDSLSVYAIVTMDESSGNLYKEAYVQDVTASMYLRFTSSSGLYEGDSIRIDLRGTTLKKYNQMLQLDSLDADLNIFKQATESPTVSESVSLVDLALYGSQYQSRLVYIDAVEFICDDLNQTFADAVNQESFNRYIQDAIGNQLIVRTSGYSNFADDIVPSGNGTITAIVSQYNDDIQLLIRRPSEANFPNNRLDDCDAVNPDEDNDLLLFKDFDDNSITSGGWTSQLVFGPSNCAWGIFEGANSAAVVTNYDDGSNSSCESWIISPSVDLSGTSPSLSFRNSFMYTGTALQLFVSTDYNDGNPNDANWVELTDLAVWDLDSDPNSGWEFYSSGEIDLSNYTSENVHIGFKYSGSDNDGSKWELDDIQIVNNQ